MSETTEPRESWVVETCTLPTAERPLRVAEFDGLFRTAVRAVERTDPARLRLTLAPDAATAARAADLAVRETGCCSFFTFTLEMSGGQVLMEVAVPPEQVGVLDALAVRAGAGR